ncbi:MAG: host attachment protein [Sideroxyarcus sp.]|nr:host attachment protein [Sideroxyarcus sp.]
MAEDVIWALILTSARARIMRGVQPKLTAQPPELVLRSEARHFREAMPGILKRATDGYGNRRPSVIKEAVAVLREDARDFVREVIAVLEAHRRAGDYTKLAIFAPADMLGLLWEELPTVLRGLVIVRVERDFMRLAPTELSDRLGRDFFGV